jgi:hypothetical protein
MADTAFQTVYRQEHINAFERRQSVLRMHTITEANVRGNQAVFLVAGSGGAVASTRGTNGLIPARADDLTQNTCTLSEQHDLVRKTGFNIFASQGDQRRIMQETTMAVINRKIDAQIITELETGTQDVSATTQTASLNAITHVLAILGNQNAGGGYLCAAITPAFYSYLLQIKEFGSVDYTNIRPFDRNTNEDAMNTFNWMGMSWVVHTGLTGAGTSSETCLFWNRKAIGHAADSSNMTSLVGFDGEQDYSWARCSMYMGAKLLQNTGVVKFLHDGSAFASV